MQMKTPILVAAALLTCGTAAALASGAAAAQIVVADRASLEAGAIETTPMVRGGTVRAAVEIVIAPGFHVNANPPTYDWLIPISVSLEGPDGVELVDSYYPEAEHKKFPYDEKPFAVYEGSVVVGLELTVSAHAPLGEQNLQLKLDYQACNDEACYAPTATTLELPVTVAPAGSSVQTVESPLLKRAPSRGGSTTQEG